MAKQKVLFLCTGNSARSQLGEALLRHRAGDEFEVYSAGLEPKGVNPYTVRVLEDKGLDTSVLWSKDVAALTDKVAFTHVITVCGHADENCPAVLLDVPHRLHWPFEDPAKFEGDDAAILAKFREVRDLIDAKIQAWLVEEGITATA